MFIIIITDLYSAFRSDDTGALIELLISFSSLIYMSSYVHITQKYYFVFYIKQINEIYIFQN